MKIVNGNILDATYGIIGHQVNCQLVMGSGIAKQIRDKYPNVFNEYSSVMSKVPIASRLGKCQITTAIPNKLFIANLFGQFHYAPRDIKHTDYTALGIALRNLQRWKNTFVPDFTVYLPFGIGCGLGGGDWAIVRGLIEDAIPDAVIVRLK